jgi:eukaryotic-like serine/threonine-protein kinase
VSDSEASIPFRSGDLIAGKYRVERVLGAGGMGVVVEAMHVDLERKVAVKLIREELAAESSTVERLMLEAKAAAKIRSEHVGKVLDVGKLPSGAPYIVMEYLEGCDLCQLLEGQGALKITQAVDYVMQACEALAEAHAARIVHRDLKPENLFVARQADGSPIIKVLDFGISKQLGNAERRQLTNPSTAVGSPRYMAPEQMQAGEVDVRADIWSLGAILYECLSNHAAFDSDTLPGICAQVLSQDPKPLEQRTPHVPSRLAEVITRCLKKNRDERFSNIAELADALAPFGTERATLSRRRINTLLGGLQGLDATLVQHPASFVDSQGKTAVVDTGSVLAAAAAADNGTTAGRGLSLDLSGQRSSPTSQVKQRASWPFIVLPLAALALGAGAFLLLQEPETAASSSEGGGGLSAAVEALPKAELPVSSAAALPVATEATEEPSSAQEDVAIANASAQASAEVSEPTPSATSASPRPARPPRGAPPKSKPEEKKSNASDAWDPNNFGGRQ